MKRKAEELSAQTHSKSKAGRICAQRLKSFRCVHAGCTRVYNRPSKLADHLRSHTGERPFCCSEPACTKRFLRKSHLQAHARSHLSEEDRPYECSEENCAKRFSTNQHLRQHVALHYEPCPYDCTHCGESFHKHTQLKRHVADVHLHTKPCPCPQDGCNMSFAYQSILDKHVARVHDTTKRYGCEMAGCGQTFTKWSHLQSHVKESHKIHCKYCKKAYTDKTALRLHTETHEIPLSQRMRFPCSQCDKAFTKAYSLNRHTVVVHDGAREFACTQCDHEFAHKKSLVTHVERCHSSGIQQEAMSANRPVRPKVVSLLNMLTGAGYSESGRSIHCVKEGCAYMFTRQYDLKRHLIAKHCDDEIFMDRLLSSMQEQS